MRFSTRLVLMAATILPVASLAQSVAAPERTSILGAAAAGIARADSQSVRFEPKSEATAIALSAGTTLGLSGIAALSQRGTANTAATALIVSALYLGPATGYWYAGSPQWKPGFIVRSVGLGMMAGGVALWSSSSSLESSNAGVGAVFAVTGAGVIVVDAFVDIAKVGGAVRAVNAAHAGVQVTPVIAPLGNGVGLGATVTF